MLGVCRMPKYVSESEFRAELFRHSEKFRVPKKVCSSKTAGKAGEVKLYFSPAVYQFQCFVTWMTQTNQSAGFVKFRTGTFPNFFTFIYRHSVPSVPYRAEQFHRPLFGVILNEVYSVCDIKIKFSFRWLSMTTYFAVVVPTTLLKSYYGRARQIWRAVSGNSLRLLRGCVTRCVAYLEIIWSLLCAYLLVTELQKSMFSLFRYKI